MSDDIPEDEKAYMVLSPIHWPNVTPRSTLLHADCGHECFISESGRMALADDPDSFETLCVPCFQMRVAEDESGEPLKFGAIPGAQQQLQEVFGIDGAEAEKLIENVFDKLRGGHA